MSGPRLARAGNQGVLAWTTLLVGLALVGSFAVVPAASSATVSSAWQAKIGTRGVNGTAKASVYTAGTGSLTLRLVKMRPATLLPVVLHKGTCSTVGPVLARLDSIRSTGAGAAARTSSLSATRVRALMAATRTGKVVIRIGSGSALRCGLFVKLPVASPAPSPSASASPGASPGPPDLPPTPGGPVPAGLRPSIGEARTDYPLPYQDGCHVKQEDTVSGPCEYGVRSSSTTVVLMGDSHALSWFPAVNRLAIDRGWRLVNLTKSACASADFSQWNPTLKRVYTECNQWRENTYRRIEAEKPDLVLIANSRMFQAVGPDGTTILKGEARTEAWRQGMDSTLARITPAAGEVVLIGDTPRSMFDVPVCLSAHPDDTLACATPFEKSVSLAWLAEEEAVAAAGGAGFVDPTPWVCPTGPCPAVIGNFMVLRDEHHLTTPFSGALWRRLGDALDGLGAAP